MVGSYLQESGCEKLLSVLRRGGKVTGGLANVLVNSLVWEKTLPVAMGDLVAIVIQSLDSKDD